MSGMTPDDVSLKSGVAHLAKPRWGSTLTMLRQSNLALWLIGIIMTSAGHGGAQAGSIDRLTEHKWQRLVDYGASHPPDVTTWEFYKEGSFRKTFIADYTVRYVGAWSVSVIGQDRGVLFLSSLPRGAEAPRRYDALSFALKETELQLGEDWYRAIPLSAQEPVPGASQEERSEEHTSELQSPYDLVCRLLLEKKKKKENDTIMTQFSVLDAGM